MRKFLQRLWREDEGQDLVEYALLVTLIALTITAAMNGVATALSSVFSNASASLS